MERISKDRYYLSIAEMAAQRSTCLRRHYGAIIVNNDEIVSSGYNGAPRGEMNCCDCGYCEREAKGVPKGERYELCVAVHAEQNAIISASRREMDGRDHLYRRHRCQGWLLCQPGALPHLPTAHRQCGYHPLCGAGERRGAGYSTA